MDSHLHENDIYKMDKDFSYTGRQTNEISFPLGGIGTGSIGLAGNGRLIDWEIFNRPNKNSYNGFSFFALKAEHKGEVRVAKVLQGDLHPPYTGSGADKYKGFGFGVHRESMAGFPHFKTSNFKGTFPFAEVELQDDTVPLEIKLTAYNPFIPLNDKDSSLPAAIFSFEVVNHSEEELDISIVGNLTNPFENGAKNHYTDAGLYKGIKLSSDRFSQEAAEYGDLTLSTDGEEVSYQSYWYRGGWFDNLTVFWKEFTAPGKFKERNYDQFRVNGDIDVYNLLDVCLLSNHKTLKPHEKGEFRFVISWNYPNYVNYWNPGTACQEDSCCSNPQWKNYYAKLFHDSLESANYVWTHLERLHQDTRLFAESLFGSTLPDCVIDAISSNLSVLKSPTVARLTDGTLYGFEGCHAESGCCEGSCSHVWNYEQVTPFLFPGLARSMRKVDYKAALFDDGKMAFRIMLPIERTLYDNPVDCTGADKAAVDGQMGGIIKVFREWKICGDTDWLRTLWPQVKKSLAFAWDPANPEWWDRNGDGVMEGIQHHTLDVDIYGPNSYMTGYYLAALLSAFHMARAVGDPDATRYEALYNQGRVWVNEHLFNGEYFYQKIDLRDDRFPIDPELGEIKYQIAEGCHIDQVVGQWQGHIAGLGYIFDQDKVVKAMESIYKYNFIESMRDYPNACRIYALNDEKGLTICTWPKGGSPKVPIPYAEECMNGFEYAAASHMIYEGLLEEGIKVVKAVRERYNGENRNPWNEFECGSNYARSMASYSLLLALSGFEYDMVQGHIGFNPAINSDPFRCFWSLNLGWGFFSHEDGQIALHVQKGQLTIKSFSSALLDGKKILAIRSAENQLSFHREANRVIFDRMIQLDPETPMILDLG
jgi:non-lysosomal glucosylceramidase